MPWTREQAIEMGRKGARKGGLARAARLSPERRFEISVLGSTARWWRGSSEVEWIDRQLDHLTLIAAYALKKGDLESYQRAIQAQLPWIKMHIWARRLKEADERAAEQRRTGRSRRDGMRVCWVSVWWPSSGP